MAIHLELVIYSRELKCFAIYFNTFIITSFIDRKITWKIKTYFINVLKKNSRRAGSDGSRSASGSAGPGFDPRWGSKFSFENFQPWS